MKIKWYYFSSLNHNFIVLCELLIPCQLFAQKRQKCSNCQEILVTKYQNVRGPPEHSAIGNIHRDILLLGITVKPRYNEVLGTMQITLLYQVSHYIRVKKQRNIKSWDQQNYLVTRGFCYIRPLYINEVPLYYVTTCHSNQLRVGLMVLSDGMVHFLNIEKNFNKSTKTILWL